MSTIPSLPLYLPPSSGSPHQFHIPWQIFVQAVLEITIAAYQQMHQASIAERNWEEDTFTINLEHYLRPIAYHHPLNLTVICRTKTHTPAMRAGQVSSKQAKEIDIRLWGRWENYDQIYFSWEGKRVTDKLVDKENAFLTAEYITEGLFRFLDEEYSAHVDDAGMLGYVLAGEVTNIINDINRSMQDVHRIRKLSETDHLKLASNIGNFACATCVSNHKRSINSKPIRLHHLFLTFDFDQGKVVK